MNRPSLTIQLERHNGLYFPGETLRAEVHLRNPDAVVIQSLEISVLWYTVGQGEEDIAVHFFRREETTKTASVSSDQPLLVECALPESPLSYGGLIVKVCWCVRARMFLEHGREVIEETPFRLGNVPAATAVIDA